MFSIDNLRSLSKTLEKEIQLINNHIANMDHSTALVVRNSKFDTLIYAKKFKDAEGKWKEEYLPQSAENEIKKLAYQKYAVERLKDAKNEKRAIDHVIRVLSSESHVERYLQKHPGVHAMLKDWLHVKGDRNLMASEDEIRRMAEAWKNTPYKKSQNNPEYLKYPTVVKGLKTRSKSEADIVSRFEHFGVAYHYEEEFELPDYMTNLYRRNTFAIHPDFKCKNMRTGNVYWWEHQGQWDNPSYVADLRAREEILFKAGLVPWKNLIITTETLDMPLDIQWVDQIIQFFLL